MKLTTISRHTCATLMLFSSFGWSQQSIEVSTGIHSKQASGQQPGLGYRYQLNDVLAIKSHYFYADRVEVEQDRQTNWVDYQHWLVGAEFLHQQSGWQLTIGGGVDFVTQSSNAVLIKESQVSPYISFGASYPLSPRWSLSVNQLLHFSSDGLGNYQSLQLGIQYNFGTLSNRRPIGQSEQSKQLSVDNQIAASPSVEVKASPNLVKSTPVASMSAAEPETCWLIQWGVFASGENAMTLRERISQSSVNVSLLQDNDNIRVVSQCFPSKQTAVKENSSLLQQYKLRGFVREYP
ncbi:outer membrane beta-barrel protein [Thalassotalea fusca]